MLYGVVTLISGVMKVELTFNKARLRMKNGALSAVNAVVTLFCAFFILSNPLSTTAALWTFVGISLILEAILDFVVAFLPSKNDNVIDGTATEKTVDENPE